jgi:hypothetical protein
MITFSDLNGCILIEYRIMEKKYNENITYYYQNKNLRK